MAQSHSSSFSDLGAGTKASRAENARSYGSRNQVGACEHHMIMNPFQSSRHLGRPCRLGRRAHLLHTPQSSAFLSRMAAGLERRSSVGPLHALPAAAGTSSAVHSHQRRHRGSSPASVRFASPARWTAARAARVAQQLAAVLLHILSHIYSFRMSSSKKCHEMPQAPKT